MIRARITTGCHEEERRQTPQKLLEEQYLQVTYASNAFFVFFPSHNDRSLRSLLFSSPAGVGDRIRLASASIRELHSIVLLLLRVLAIHLRRLTGSPHLSASAHRNGRRASAHVVVASGSVLGRASVCCRDRHRAAMEMPLILLQLALPRAAMRKLNGSPHLSASA